MKSELLGMLILLSVVGVARAAEPELERPRQTQTIRVAEATPARSAHPKTSPARKAEVARRMFWLALSLR